MTVGVARGPADAVTGRAQVRVLDVPVRPVEQVAAAAGGEPLLVWDPPEGPTLVGIGAAAVAEGRGPDRFGELVAQARRLQRGLEGPEAPRWIGGLAFAPGGAERGPWRGFGDARFVLPRWTYVADGGRATLLAVVGTLDPALPPSDPEAGARLLRALHSDRAPEAPRPTAPPDLYPRAAQEDWTRRCRTALADIEAGAFDKLVLARRQEVPAASDARSLLAGFGRRRAGATRFLFDFGGAVFAGATPERLVERRGPFVRTEALAGTCEPGGEAALLASGKEALEHALVVRAIEEALAPLAASVERPDRPRLRRLPDVVHLATPIEARLREPLHLLRLAEALHPTPAVGGLPRERATEWLSAHEAEPRGWYAAPVGWFDGAGDGELRVALRSLVARDGRAWLYAGAGLVSGSDPDRELLETTLKMRTAAAALSAPSEGTAGEAA